jgi:hypothetical protein
MKVQVKNKADRDLVSFLSGIDPETIETLIQMLDTFWQVEVDSIKDNISRKGIPEAGTPERIELAKKIVYIIRYFGSHNIAYLIRTLFSDEPGVPYGRICKDVCHSLNRQLKKGVDIPRVASVSDYETMICEIMLRLQFEGKSEAEIAQMLNDAGLEEDAVKQTAKELAKFAGPGFALLALVRVLGKKIITELIHKLIVMIVAKKLGEEAAKKIAARLLAKVAQKTLARIISGIGWVLLVKDAIDCAGPAKRITIPSVSLIAALRTAQQLG